MSLCFYTILVLLIILLGGRWVIGQWNVSRMTLWAAFIVVMLGIDYVHRDTHMILRMVVLCSTLLVLMKCIVYAEWSRQTDGQMTWMRWMMFSMLWFGMDPNPWQMKRRKLSWRSDFIIGLTCLVAGWGTCFLLVHLGVSQLIAVFMAMSIAFHFGLLRLLTAFWRFCGYPVRPLFRNPLKSNGLADFWAARWNIAFSQMMARTVKRPLASHLGKRWSMFAVFLASGIFHELAITVPVQSGYGGPLTYFLLHGAIVRVERDGWPIWQKRVVTLILVVVPLPLLFPEKFTQEVILPCLNFLGG